MRTVLALFLALGFSGAGSVAAESIFLEDFESGTTCNWTSTAPPRGACECELDGTDCGTCSSCSSGVCAPNSTDHVDCGVCEVCSSGSCVVEADGQDTKDECAAIACTQFLYGWSPLGSCRRFATSTAANGTCQSGSCADVTTSCAGIGSATSTCPSSECSMSCPTGAAAVDYDSIAEICWSDGFQHDCPLDYACFTGACVWVGSCPVLFTPVAGDVAFESDIFPSGKLGLVISSGFRKPYPHDQYLLRQEPRIESGRLELRVVEERHETNYLDRVRLFAVDAPKDRTVVAEILSVLPADYVAPEELLHTVSVEMSNPSSMVRLDTGEDVTPELALSDKQIVELNTDNNVFEWKTLEIDLGDVSKAHQVKLVIDARLEFPTSPAGYALANQLDPTNLRTRLEVQDPDGSWQVVPRDVAVLTRPKEFTRVHVLDITGALGSGRHKLRLSYLYHAYIDSIFFDVTTDLPVQVTEVPFRDAELLFHGTDARTDDPLLYEFVYGLPSERELALMPGSYTRYGDVTELLRSVDDRFVIFGTGDEVRIRFDDPGTPPPGLGRRFVLYSNGYYKTYKAPISLTVAPLPFAAMSNFPYDESIEHYPDDAEHNQYLEEWNTRVVD